MLVQIAIVNACLSSKYQHIETICMPEIHYVVPTLLAE